MSAAHTLYAAYASFVASNDAPVKDLKAMVRGIKGSSRCDCLACEIVTSLCLTCAVSDKHIMDMSKQMTDGNAWKMQDPSGMWWSSADHLCPFGADRRWEVEAAAQYRRDGGG